MSKQSNIGRRIRVIGSSLADAESATFRLPIVFFLDGDLGTVTHIDGDGYYWATLPNTRGSEGPGPWCIGRPDDGFEFLDDATHAEAAASIVEDVD